MKKILVSVINDLSTDQRVHKVCNSLHSQGYTVTLIGRKQKTSRDLLPRPYSTKRMRLFFEKGMLFYLEYQIRLFFVLLTNKQDVLIANDLDTLLPNYLTSKIKGAQLIYDSHELFCEVPELQNRPFKKKCWKTLEKWIFPHLKNIFTVNNSIATIYSKEYNVSINVMRNTPVLTVKDFDDSITKASLNIPEEKHVLLLQGAGINADRGAEEAVEMMQYIRNAVLLIIGKGDVVPLLKQRVKSLKLDEKILFIDYVPFENLHNYTRLASIGLSLDKPTNDNYRYSLPNKLFDYIHAEVPVISSKLVEVEKIVTDYAIGLCIDNHSPQHIAEKVNFMLKIDGLVEQYKENTEYAKECLHWENEVQTLLATVRK